MERREIYFRADAGPRIGYGHYIRSLALADMLKDEFDCTFFTQAPTEYQKKEAEGVCPLIPLPSDDTRFDLFLQFLKGDEIVVLDNYYYTSEYQLEIKRKGCKLVCIDDVHDKHFYADVIINHCAISCTGYDAEAYTKYYLGAKWALLRKPFIDCNKFNKDSNRWLITFGGSDPNNLTLSYVLSVKKLLPKAHISVMVGDGYMFLDELKGVHDINIYNKLPVRQVADLLKITGNVICSASSVCYESLACGCNVYAGYYIDNQKDFYNCLVSQGFIHPLGDLNEYKFKFDLNSLNMKFHTSFSGIADRYRILFHSLNVSPVKYQDMTVQQSLQVWECRNNSLIRQWMNNPEPFSFDSHCNFIEKLNNDPSKIYYAFFYDKCFIGSYDFVGIVDGVEAERGLFVNPDFQGRHIASMMEIFMEGEIVKRGVKRLYAEVLKINDKSYRYHLRSGYNVFEEDDVYYHLDKYL